MHMDHQFSGATPCLLLNLNIKNQVTGVLWFIFLSYPISISTSAFVLQRSSSVASWFPVAPLRSFTPASCCRSKLRRRRLAAEGRLKVGCPRSTFTQTKTDMLTSARSAMVLIFAEAFTIVPEVIKESHKKLSAAVVAWAKMNFLLRVDDWGRAAEKAARR